MKEQSKEIKTSSFVFHMMSIILGGIVGDVFSTVRARMLLKHVLCPFDSLSPYLPFDFILCISLQY